MLLLRHGFGSVSVAVWKVHFHGHPNDVFVDDYGVMLTWHRFIYNIDAEQQQYFVEKRGKHIVVLSLLSQHI